MIDIDNIEAWCNLAVQNGYGHLPVIECGNSVKILELISLLRQYEKDAERYRWLLNQHNNVMSKVMVCDGWMLSEPDEVDLIDDLSSFIDEAMK